jgi:predicted transcriptional regulator
MKTTTERAAEALDLLPEDMRERAIAYLIEQAEKFRFLKKELDKGMADIEAGRVREWDFGDFLRRAKLADVNAETE